MEEKEKEGGVWCNCRVERGSRWILFFLSFQLFIMGTVPDALLMIFMSRELWIFRFAAVTIWKFF